MCADKNNGTLQALCHTHEIMSEMSNRHVFSLYKRRTNKCEIVYLRHLSAFFLALKNKISTRRVDCPGSTKSHCESYRVKKLE